jgi:hypothetical protein
LGHIVQYGAYFGCRIDGMGDARLDVLSGMLACLLDH